VQVDLSRAKPHPRDRPAEPDDPLNLHAVEVDGDPDLMLRLLVEEYARLGWRLDSLLAMFRDPFYQAAHGLWLLYGEEELRRRITATLARCGVLRASTAHAQPASERLVQLDLPQATQDRAQKTPNTTSPMDA
jgi:hypothetical protein